MSGQPFFTLVSRPLPPSLERPPQLLLAPTSLGPMPWSRLDRVMTIRENDDVSVVAYEFYFEGAMVHRSAHVMMKRWPTAKAQVGRLA